jgi:hypothetical protein
MRAAVTTKLLIGTAAAMAAVAVAGLVPIAEPRADPQVFLVIEETGGAAPADLDCPYDLSAGPVLNRS